MVSIPRGGCHGNPIVNGHEVVLDVELDIAGRGERPKDFSLWVWSYCDNSDLFLAWTVVPKDSVRCRCGLFSISLKNFLPFRTFEGCELMGLQTGVSWICRKILDGFLDCLVPFRKSFVSLKPI